MAVSTLLPHLAGEPFDLPPRQHLLVNHPDQELFHRPGPEPIDDLFHGVGGHASGRCLRAIDEDLPVDVMLHVSPHLEPAEQGAHARVFERMVWLKRLSGATTVTDTGPSCCAAEENLDQPNAHNQCCGDL